MHKQTMRILLLICILFISFNSSADPTLDSLITKLETYENHNSQPALLAKAELSEQIADYYTKIYSDQTYTRIYLLQAIDFLKTHIENAPDVDPNNIIQVANLYRKIGMFEAFKGDSEVSSNYMDKSESFLKSAKSKLDKDIYTDAIFDFYHSKFAYYYRFQEFEAAEKSLLTCLKLIEENPVVSDMRMNVLSELSVIYTTQQKHEDAVNAAEAGLVLFMEEPQLEVPKDRFIHFVLRALKNGEQNDRFLNRIKELHPYDKLENLSPYLDANPEMVTRTFFLNVFMIGEVYQAKFEATDSSQYLEQAYQWMNEGFSIAEKRTVINNGDKMGNVILKPKDKLFMFLEVCEDLNNQNKLNRERLIALNRIIDVYQSSRLHLERISFGINSESWAEEKELKNQLNYISTKIKTVNNNNPEERVERDSLQKKFNELSYTLSTTKQRTKRNAVLEEYNAGRAQFTSQTETFLSHYDKTILTYCYAAALNKIFISGINKTQHFFEAVSVPDDFENTVTTAYALNSTFLTSKQEVQKQDSLNTLLYTYLMAPISSKLDSSNLLIYPLNELSYVSFDALLDPNKTYLTEKYSLQFASSLFSIVNPKAKSNKELKAHSFHPTNYGSDSLAVLSYAAEEAAGLSKILDAKTWTEQEATKNNFLTKTAGSNIIHIASHSILNNEQPYESYIIFNADSAKNDNKLFAYEIFASTLDAELISLSSCNSGNGNIEEGIGVVSLSNAFYFAGIPSTVSSLWSAQDKSSSTIMLKFYEGLAEGNSKSLSLQEAKLAYLQSADKLKKQPFFWANYVLYGSDVPIYEKPNNKNWSWLIIVMGALLISVIGFFVIKKKRKD